MNIDTATSAATMVADIASYDALKKKLDTAIATNWKLLTFARDTYEAELDRLNVQLAGL